ncbi:hypothetical protein J6590_061441 [Homalodisca vitripennis]|nr:hypothetical protein J6590_061441 [Homalodisca vitripennis]
MPRMNVIIFYQSGLIVLWGQTPRRPDQTRPGVSDDARPSYRSDNNISHFETATNMMDSMPSERTKLQWSQQPYQTFLSDGDSNTAQRLLNIQLLSQKCQFILNAFALQMANFNEQSWL